MPHDFTAAFAGLKSIFEAHLDSLVVKADTPREYLLVTRTPSPFPQHRGEPMFFGSVRIGKAYTSFHLMPIYMCPPLQNQIPPALKKRMQGKSCFNFKDVPEPEVLAGLRQLTAASARLWQEKGWM
jgi:hypothetical protein